MNIGILGSGSVAQFLGNGFIKYGYNVMLGTRDLNKLADWKEKAGDNGMLGSFEETANYGEIIVLAVKGKVAETILVNIKTEYLAGKTIIDATNPIDDSKAPLNGVLNFFTDLNDSLMEKLQRKIPDANFVKAFNSVGAHLMVNPSLGDSKPTMFICGNNPEAKNQVSDILNKFGWDIADMGKAEAARAIEPLCMLWCIPGFLGNNWMHAFKLLK